MSQMQQYGHVQQSRAEGRSERSLLFPTQNYLPRDVRESTIEMLNRSLADTTVLLTQTKFAHWNVKGIQFYSLHLLFDEIAESLEHHADEIGERITALGGQAMGTASMAASNSTIPRMPTDAVTGQEYVEILADHLAIHDSNLFESIETAQSYGDADTADLLNEVSREVSKHLWFLEAHLQTEPVGAVQAPSAPQSTIGPTQTDVGQGQSMVGQSQTDVSGTQAGTSPTQGPIAQTQSGYEQQSSVPTQTGYEQSPTGAQGSVTGSPPATQDPTEYVGPQ